MISNLIQLLQTKDISSLKNVTIEIWDLLIFISFFWIGIGLYYFNLYIIGDNKT